MSIGAALFALAAIALAGTAIGLVVWGLRKERGDRHDRAQGSEVFGEREAEHASPEGEKRPAGQTADGRSKA